ncbi:hypothetical protein [Streptomyces sp. NPDC059564]|uniref:hypothetical protein n=1 Tax=Streptomyces sp. NPDC059564 TaxID=3346865 RepID=UPI00369889D1
MSETTPNDHGPAPVQLTPEVTEPVFIPADQVKPEDIGTLSIEYRDGQPVIVVSGGTAIPAELTVLDAADHAVAAYSAGPVRSARKDGLYYVNFVTNHNLHGTP